jgi:hypothetical protein
MEIIRRATDGHGMKPPFLHFFDWTAEAGAIRDWEGDDGATFCAGSGHDCGRLGLASVAIANLNENERASQPFLQTVFQSKQSRIAECQDQILPQYFRSSVWHVSQRILSFVNQPSEEKYPKFRKV